MYRSVLVTHAELGGRADAKVRLDILVVQNIVDVPETLGIHIETGAITESLKYM